MSRRYTRRGTALLLVLALLVSMLGAALPVMQKSGAASGTFATAYTALLEKAPVAQADLERDPYGLCRLVVTGYGGKDYGAVTAAVHLLLQLPPAPLCPAPMGRPVVRCC